jgi:hypothetical protein
MPALLRRPLPFRAVLAALAAVAVVLLAPAPAALASPEAVIDDCQDGSIGGRYTARDFAQALRDIPTDVDEYTDCRDVIRRAQLQSAGGTGGGTPGGGDAGGDTGGGTSGGGASGRRAPTVERVLRGASPDEQAAVRQAVASGGSSGPVQVAGETIDPARIARGANASSSPLPGVMLVALVLLGLAVLAGSAQLVRTRVLGRRPAV